MKKNFILALLTFALFSCLLTACGETRLSGKYLSESYYPGFPEEIEFEKDGDCDYMGTGGTYEIEDGKIRFRFGGISLAFECTINGDTLILSDDSKSVTYNKQYE